MMPGPTKAQSKARIKEVSKALLTLKLAEQKSKNTQKKLDKIEKLYERAKAENIVAGLNLLNAKMEFSDMNSWSKP